MAAKTFEGKSERGDFQEALNLAIQAAMEGLSTTFVKWQMESVSGENGGITGVNEMTITILVLVPQ